MLPRVSAYRHDGAFEQPVRPRPTSPIHRTVPSSIAPASCTGGQWGRSRNGASIRVGPGPAPRGERPACASMASWR